MLTLFTNEVADGTLVLGEWMEFKPHFGSGGRNGLIPCLLEVEGELDGATAYFQIRTQDDAEPAASLYNLTAVGISPYFYLKWGWSVRGALAGGASAMSVTMRLHP